MIEKYINKIQNWLIILLFTSMLTLIVLQIVLRLVGSALVWSEEVTRYIFVWISFIGMASAAKTGEHMKTEIFCNFFPKPIRKYLPLLSDIIFFVFCILGLYAGIKMVQAQIISKRTLTTLNNIPMWIASISCVIGFLLTALQIIFGIFNEKLKVFSKTDESISVSSQILAD